ncbi:type II toxin-antitoxin system RelE/ParE family toxin [Oenococcus kitaharae]|uniref:RelE/StbE family protein addiction module toxin n=1 Tax=Oenococcus kitaharae DSM 17330 TaxID=1045004 RepID=G9WJV5_9LACO|nr:type II toxin-antitoxin system RelE/ParE family toxin [Oenococcus kitaharae]EHN58123.1 RelE/StbE family protein addiction module toxin [Oenococcus kitaharae DSM 17330]OEY82418.1 hypothetical protein NV75_08420 [Oenococcus kitaharae]OEY82544.1 hypothetical protein NT95_06120 [Oenococcus kitaharae]OEY84224.1 hypothetical protein NT96_05260 [Oenococcus kitaharae]
MVSKHYEIKYAIEVSDKIDQIYAYTLNLSRSKETAQKTVGQLILAIDRLNVFPEAGLDIDQKIGVQLRPPYKTYGLIAGKYIVIYEIVESSVVLISQILAANSDWIELLTKQAN